jgi:hypothetical protein
MKQKETPNKIFNELNKEERTIETMEKKSHIPVCAFERSRKPFLKVIIIYCFYITKSNSTFLFILCSFSSRHSMSCKVTQKRDVRRRPFLSRWRSMYRYLHPFATKHLHRKRKTRREKNSSTSRQYTLATINLSTFVDTFRSFICSKNLSLSHGGRRQDFSKEPAQKKIQKIQQNCIKVTFKIERIQWNASDGFSFLLYIFFLLFIIFSS